MDRIGGARCDVDAIVQAHQPPLVGAFLPPLDFFIVNVALPSIQGELGASSSAEQLVISAYAALYAVTLTTGGRLGDLYGRGRMFFIGLIGFADASLLCGFAWSPWALIAGRALQGMTAAMMAPQALASVQAIFPEAEKPMARSVFTAPSSAWPPSSGRSWAAF